MKPKTLLAFPLPATHFDQWGINKHINIPSLQSSMRCSRVPPVQPHRQHSVIISDTAHQTHLNKFIRLGTQQNASLSLKKSLWATAKSTIWCDCCSFRKAKRNRSAWSCLWEGLGGYQERGCRGQWTIPKSWRVSALLLRVFFPDASWMESGSSVLPLPDCCTWRTQLSDVCQLLLNPAPHLFHVWQPAGQHISGQAGAQSERLLQVPGSPGQKNCK